MTSGAVAACEPAKKKVPPPLPPPSGGLQVAVEHEDDTTEGILVVSVTCVFTTGVVAFDAEWEIPYGGSAGVADLGEGTVCDLELEPSAPPVTIDPEPPVTIAAGPLTTISILVQEQGD